MAYARISITLPRDLVTAADRRARTLDRSRSWLLAEALREYLARPGAVRPAGLGEYRLEQLKADLRLTPEQRVLAAARTANVAEPIRRDPLPQRILQFDRYEDYLDWKCREDIR